MSHFRLLLPLLVAGLLPMLVLAQDPSASPPPPPPEPPTEAEQTLDEAMAKLRATERVTATIHQEVDMLGEVFTVEGQYAQAGPYTFSLDLQVEGLPQTQGRMRQVSDGQVLWDVSQILDQTYYFRLALPEILRRVQEEPFDAFHRNMFLQQRLGLSGPHWLLDGLRQSVRFDRRTEGEYNGRPVWIVRGNWKDMNALGFGPMASVPAYIPSVVEVQVDKETGWPYQVLLLGKPRSILRSGETPKVDLATGRPVGTIAADEEPTSRFLLTYSDVQFGAEIDPSRFTFRVPEVDRDRVRDRTPDLLAELEQMVRYLEAQKLQPGATPGAGTPATTLDNGIDIPPLGNEPTSPAPVQPAPATPPNPGN